MKTKDQKEQSGQWKVPAESSTNKTQKSSGRRVGDFDPIDDALDDIPETVGMTIPESIGPTFWPMTTSGMLIGRWENAWEMLNGLPRTGSFETMVSRYTESRRHYHTMLHLAECFDAFDLLSHHCDRPMEVEMAIWFHDAFYDPARHDNEIRSSELAFNSLTKSGVELLAASRVAKLVLATEHRNPPPNVDAGILVDVDLSILGSNEDRFRQYETQIRWEYSHLSDEFYLKGRTLFVARLLKKVKEGGNIYRTPEFRRDVEPRAVANLQASLRRMKAGQLPSRTPLMNIDGE